MTNQSTVRPGRGRYRNASQSLVEAPAAVVLDEIHDDYVVIVDEATSQVALDDAAFLAVANARSFQKFDVTEVSTLLHVTAEKFVHDYKGDFNFLLSLKRRLDSGKSLSAPQAKGALNCKLNDVKRATKTLAAPLGVANAAVPAVAAGLYIVDSDVVKVTVSKKNGTPYTHTAKGSKWVYSGRNHLARIDGESIARVSAAEAKSFADISGRCIACRRTLTTTKSVGHGYGPVCAANHGWDY